MIKSTLLFGWVVVCLILPQWLFGQCYDVTLNPSQDSYITTQSAKANYGSSSIMRCGTYYFRGRDGVNWQFYQRAFVAFDVSSIPSNAIISKATLELTRSGTIQGAGTFSWKTKRITSSWSEAFISSSSQPAISSLYGDVTSVLSTTASVQEMDVTSMLQRMVQGTVTNYGWCIQVSNEAASANTGCSFYSGNSAYKPKLVVEYHLPVVISNVHITHESATGASDGGISLDHTCLDKSGHTYSWINASGVQVAASQNLSNVSYGWYGLEITGANNGKKEYFGFLVGTKCEEVTISYTTRPEYTDNAMVYDRIIPNGLDYRDINYGNITYIRTQNWNMSPWTAIKSYVDFNTWMDDEFTINQAELTMEGWAHYNNGTTNTSQFNKVTSAWDEELVTWNTAPTNASLAGPTIASTSATNQDAVIDMSSFWDDWQQDNTTNYGVVFQLDAFDNNGNARQMYFSPAYSGASLRPRWTFKLQLGKGYECGDYTFYLKDELEQSIAYVPGNALKFKFQEDYNDASGTVSYRLILLENDSEQTGTISKNHQDNWFTLENGVGGVSLQSGKIYILEVENAKGQKKYLKVKMS